MTTTFGSSISGISQTTKLIILAAMVQVLDVLSFVLAYSRHGISDNELLPIPEYLYNQGGLAAILIVKVAMVVLSIAAMLILYHYKGDKDHNLAKVGAYSVLYVGLLGFLVNMWAWTI